MGRIEETLQTFDQHIKAAHEQISDTTRKISAVDENIHRLLMEFKSNMDRLSIQKSNLFEKELSGLLEQYKDDCAEWCQAVTSMVEGKEFINQFEKSVLIVVFGNVNVGKSSVGNLIAGTVDTSRTMATVEADVEMLKMFFGEPPVFYEYDFAGMSESRSPKRMKDSFFKEGCVETTANIQYFTRNGGMTWTDSPGICSINKDNGDLAKKYVEFADLVIFITSSSSPCKNDEIQELKKLFKKEKPVLILINKSDEVVQDEVDGQIVKCLIPKSQEDRHKQEEYIQEQFRKEAAEILFKIDAVSISTYLAMEGLREGDAEKFKQSGFPRLYEKLGEIFEKNAIDLKMNAPRRRINSIIDEIISGGDMGAQRIKGISQYRECFEAKKAIAENTKKEIGRVAEEAIPAILYESMAKITSYVQEQAHQVRKSGADIKLGQEVNRIITEQAANVLEREIQEILEDYNNGMADLSAYQKAGEISLNARKEQVERYVYDVKDVRRAPEGLIEHIEHFLFKTEFTRSEVRKRKITDFFVNGDNSSEILERISQETSLAIREYVQELVQNVQTHYFAQVEALTGNILDMLHELEKKLKGEKIRDGGE